MCEDELTVARPGLKFNHIPPVSCDASSRFTQFPQFPLLITVCVSMVMWVEMDCGMHKILLK